MQRFRSFDGFTIKAAFVQNFKNEDEILSIILDTDDIVWLNNSYYGKAEMYSAGGMEMWQELVDETVRKGSWKPI